MKKLYFVLKMALQAFWSLRWPYGYSPCSEDPDQTPHHAASNLVLQFLPMTHKKDIRLYMGRDARKPVFWVSDKGNFKPVSSATETV